MDEITPLNQPAGTLYNSKNKFPVSSEHKNLINLLCGGFRGFRSTKKYNIILFIINIFNIINIIIILTNILYINILLYKRMYIVNVILSNEQFIPIVFII